MLGRDSDEEFGRERPGGFYVEGPSGHLPVNRTLGPNNRTPVDALPPAGGAEGGQGFRARA